MSIHYEGILIGVFTFILIGIFHPIVIKGEYHFGTKIWPVFLILGCICCIVSLIINSLIISSVLAITGIIFLWSIKELFEQKKRVERGWYPKKNE